MTTTAATPAAGDPGATTPETPAAGGAPPAATDASAPPPAAATTAAAATTTSTDAGVKPGGKDGGDSQPKPPETYTLTLPEGGRVDADDMHAVETIARENGWTNDQAQAALESHAEALTAQSVRFLAQTTADPTYGGEHLATTQARAKAVLAKVRPAGTPRGDALRALLDKSGYGNHVEVIGFLADLGALMGEDTLVGGGAGGAKAPKTIADILYPGQ